MSENSENDDAEIRREHEMISEKMKPYVKNNSAIRMMFEEGNRLRAKYGADKVFDFSLGNPSVPAPDSPLPDLDNANGGKKR